MSIPDDVERLALLGWFLVPCSRRTKAACIKNAVASASCDLDTIAGWVAEFGACNWRVIFGPSGLFGLDLDVPSAGHVADGVAAFADLSRCYPPLPCGPVTRSGGGGNALFFQHRGEPIVGRTGWPAPGIDPRRGAQSVTVPPSIHVVTGRPYVWLVEPWAAHPPAAPSWLINLLRPPPEPEMRAPGRTPTDVDAARIIEHARRTIASAPPGGGNDTLNRICYSVARWVACGALGEAEAVAHLAAAADERRIPRPEARATIKSAFRAGLSSPMAVGS